MQKFGIFVAALMMCLSALNVVWPANSDAVNRRNAAVHSQNAVNDDEACCDYGCDDEQAACRNCCIAGANPYAALSPQFGDKEIHAFAMANSPVAYFSPPEPPPPRSK